MRLNKRLNKRLALPAAAACVCAALLACSENSPIAAFRPPAATAHERYGRALQDAGLDSTALGREWLAASDSALRTPLDAALPARELGFYARSEARAVAYRMSLRDGVALLVTLRTEGPSARVYLDLFEVTGDSLRRFIHRATADTAMLVDSTGTQFRLEYEPRRDAQFVLRLQPELLRTGRYELTLQAEPSLAFPVMDANNRSIQSFFGADREAGRRVHHGIDIFAPRGTPALAATDGVVRSINPNNLGGNVVWLADSARRQSLYYAHLDTQTVVAGQRVRRGDTLGFVGNTGNARTTPPHLHFGIYRRGEGPIDPLHHVRYATAPIPTVRADTALLGARGRVTVTATRLRLGPSMSDTVLQELDDSTAFSIMAASERWYRVQFGDGRTGYVSASAVQSLPR